MRISFVFLAQAYLVLSFVGDYSEGLLGGLPIVLLGDTALVGVILYALAKSKLRRELRWLLLMMTLSLAGMLLNFRYTAGLPLVVQSRALFMFVTTVFFYFFAFSRLGTDRLLKVGRFLELVLKINILVILVEGLLGNFWTYQLQPDLFTLFSDQGYRIQPHPVIFSVVPNGLVFGIQHASILAVMGVFTWFPWRGRIGMRRTRFFWLLASVVAWGLTVTGTSVVVFVVVFLAITYTGLLKRNTALFISASAFLTFYTRQSFEGLVRARYSGSSIGDIGEFFDRTLEIYLQPLSIMPDHILEALFGAGHLTEFTTQYSPLLSAITHADFGLLVTAAQFGIILGLILTAAYLVSLIKIWTRVRRRTLNSEVSERAIVLGAVGLVLTLSMVHYTTLLQSGPTQYFAASLALSYFLVRPQVSRAIER